MGGPRGAQGARMVWAITTGLVATKGRTAAYPVRVRKGGAASALLSLLPLLPLPRFASLRFARGAATPPNPLAVAP